MNLESLLIFFMPGASSNFEFRSMPANIGCLKASTRSASSGPMPPLSRNGVFPS